VSRINTPKQIEAMRESGRILAQVLQFAAEQVAVGVATEEIDAAVATETKRLGAEAAFLGHEGFPKSICISVNEAIVHGIPNSYKLKEGDVVGLDFGIRHEGMITDAAITVPVGGVNANARRLLMATEEALYLGIDQAKAGNRVGDISAAVEKHLRAANLGIIRELAGHGVGQELWEEPSISNYGVAGTGATLKAGMTVAIEPMASIGKPDIRVLDDNWTIVTKDKSLAAQFEHTVLITDGAAEILTRA
jgi:methionyl aminopeptidase